MIIKTVIFNISIFLLFPFIFSRPMKMLFIDTKISSTRISLKYKITLLDIWGTCAIFKITGASGTRRTSIIKEVIMLTNIILLPVFLASVMFAAP